MPSGGEKNLIVTNQLRELFKGRGLKTSQAAVEAINREALKICLRAADCAIADKMKTVKAAHVPSMSAPLGFSEDL